MKTIYQERRQKLMAMLPRNSVVIIRAASEAFRNGDVHYPYRQNSDFYYLTGFTEPEAIAVFIPGRKEGVFILFNQAEDPIRKQWTGACVGQENAKKEYGADEAYSIAQFMKS